MRDNGMQAEASRARFPAFTGRVIGEGGIEFPGNAAIAADPQAGGIDASVDYSWFICTTRFDDPDIREFLAAALGKLDAALWLLPRDAQGIGVKEKRPEKNAIF